MSNGTGVRRAADHPENPRQEDKRMTSSTIAPDQKIDEMRKVTVPSQHVATDRVGMHHANPMPVSGKELFVRALPTMVCVAVVLLALVVRPGVFWGTALVAVVVVLMIFSIVAWIPKPHSH
jgi:Flp pilus assembly protein TadB